MMASQKYITHSHMNSQGNAEECDGCALNKQLRLAADTSHLSRSCHCLSALYLHFLQCNRHQMKLACEYKSHIDDQLGLG